jgi:hypothetical protein
VATSDGRSIGEIEMRDPGASAVPSRAQLAAKALRCARLSQGLGDGVEGARLTAEQRLGLGRALDEMLRALAQGAAAVGHAPVGGC